MKENKIKKILKKPYVISFIFISLVLLFWYVVLDIIFGFSFSVYLNNLYSPITITVFVFIISMYIMFAEFLKTK